MLSDTMTIWKRQVERYNSLSEHIAQRKDNGEGLLRFGRCSIRASDVAGQYYCKKKLRSSTFMVQWKRVRGLFLETCNAAKVQFHSL